MHELVIKAIPSRSGSAFGLVTSSLCSALGFLSNRKAFFIGWI